MVDLLNDQNLLAARVFLNSSMNAFRRKRAIPKCSIYCSLTTIRQVRALVNKPPTKFLHLIQIVRFRLNGCAKEQDDFFVSPAQVHVKAWHFV